MFKRKVKPRRLHPNTVHLLKQVGIGLGVMSVLALLLLGVWHGTRLETFTINQVAAKGGITINREDVTASALSALSGEYWRFIPKQFSFLYPKEKIREEVEKIERIKNVQIEKVSPNELLISYEEYIPDALWCKLLIPEDCLFLDDTGYAFAVAPKLHGDSLLRFFSSEGDPAIGTSSFRFSDYEKSKQLVTKLSEIGWFVTTVEINSVGDAFLFVSDRGELKVTISDEIALIFDNLLTILNSGEFTHLKEQKFNYIDLRFGNRVFVNEFKEEVATSTINGIATSGQEFIEGE